MIDDIVTRLREQALEGIWDFTQASFDMQNAADEIERLRRALQLMSIDMRTQLAGIKMRCRCGACD